ncbi:hypothetical protein A4X09_0g6142 [Tilletia walkeri]|uniref:Uncharacterized protein n=1 Tax=Tilletia walkeri TaxID=117179 RepID=A0A8X7N4E0_9BASI|nr:hypothetical protein A4X09_0g6142 [Tilletia walkeri]
MVLSDEAAESHQAAEAAQESIERLRRCIEVSYKKSHENLNGIEDDGPTVASKGMEEHEQAGELEDEVGGQVCEDDGVEEADVSERTRLKEVLFKVCPCSVGVTREQQTKTAPLAHALQIIETVRNTLQKNTEDSDLDDTKKKHEELLSKAAKLAPPDKNIKPTQIWGQLGYGPKSADERGVDFPEQGELVCPILVAIGLTFPVNSDHLNLHPTSTNNQQRSKVTLHNGALG